MRKILLVEDEEILREAYCELLSTQPYDIDVANNGRQALERCENKRYDLILLDMMMPVLDGLGFLKGFNAKFDSRRTKIIILSNLSSGTELDQARQLGALSCLVKADLAPRQLLSTIRYELDSSSV